MLSIAEYLKNQRADGADPRVRTEALLAEWPAGPPGLGTADEGLSPARLAARRFMRENSALMGLLGQ